MSVVDSAAYNNIETYEATNIETGTFELGCGYLVIMKGIFSCLSAISVSVFSPVDSTLNPMNVTDLPSCAALNVRNNVRRQRGARRGRQ